MSCCRHLKKSWSKAQGYNFKQTLSSFVWNALSLRTKNCQLFTSNLRPLNCGFQRHKGRGRILWWPFSKLKLACFRKRTHPSVFLIGSNGSTGSGKTLHWPQVKAANFRAKFKSRKPFLCCIDEKAFTASKKRLTGLLLCLLPDSRLWPRFLKSNVIVRERK